METVAQRYFVKEVFLENSQHSPETTCASGPEACNFIKKKRLWHRFFPVKFVKFLGTPFLTEPLRWLLLRAADFVSMPRLCTIQKTSNSLAKAHLRTPFLQNSSQWLLSNVSYFFKKGKNRNNFSYLS